MSSPSKSPIPPVTGSELSLVAATAGINAALERAAQEGLQVSVSVVDAGGHLLTFSRIAGTPWSSIELSQDKAKTSVSFGMPSGVLGNMVDAASERVRMHLLLRANVVVMGGALPIRINERLVGAIGVSGASEEQDLECAEAGLVMINQVLNGGTGGEV